MALDTNVFKIVKQARDTYIKRYDEARVKKMAALKFRDQNVKPNSEKWQELEKSIPQDFDNAVSTARSEYMDTLITAIENERIHNEARVKSSFNSMNFAELQNVLSRLDGLPIDANEVAFLTEKYGNNNYWCDRALQKFSEEHGVLSVNLSPSYTEAEAVLSELSDRCDIFLRDYGRDEWNSFQVLHDAQLRKLLQRYTGGYVTDIDDKVDMLAGAVYSARSTAEQVAICGNVINSCKDQVLRDSLVTRLMEDAKLSENVIKFTCIDKIYNDLLEQRQAEIEQQNKQVSNDVRTQFKELDGRRQNLARALAKIRGTMVNEMVMADLKDCDTHSIAVLADGCSKATNITPERREEILHHAAEAIRLVRDIKDVDSLGVDGYTPGEEVTV